MPAGMPRAKYQLSASTRHNQPGFSGTMSPLTAACYQVVNIWPLESTVESPSFPHAQRLFRNMEFDVEVCSVGWREWLLIGRSSRQALPTTGHSETTDFGEGRIFWPHPGVCAT